MGTCLGPPLSECGRAEPASVSVSGGAVRRSDRPVRRSTGQRSVLGSMGGPASCGTATGLAYMWRRRWHRWYRWCRWRFLWRPSWLLIPQRQRMVWRLCAALLLTRPMASFCIACRQVQWRQHARGHALPAGAVQGETGASGAAPGSAAAETCCCCCRCCDEARSSLSNS